MKRNEEDLKRIKLETNIEIRKYYQNQMLEQSILISCLNCDHWSGRCIKFNVTPPPTVIFHGCEYWVDHVPF